jgi:3-deoxy-manno-octulosonate cytidylyltransferase (CMP-KDO synthetase)
MPVFSPGHVRGTDRVLEVAEKFPHPFVVNLQGDEPRIPAKVLCDFSAALRERTDDNCLLTCASNATIEEKNNPHTVKVVCDAEGAALYFSRAPIPYDSDGTRTTFLKHGGIYGFTRHGLERFCSFGQGTLEKIEKLEQLRALENGMRIHCIVRDYDATGIDTAEDLEKFRLSVEKNNP